MAPALDRCYGSMMERRFSAPPLAAAPARSPADGSKQISLIPSPPWHEFCELRAVHLPSLCRPRGLRIHIGTMRPRLPRPTVLALAAMVLAVPALVSATEVELVRVWPEYRAASSFTRIAEYFGGKEKAPELVVRTRPESRDGYYFLARFDSSKPLPGSILALEYVLPGEDQPRVQFFSVDVPKGSRAVLAGLTGADWPGAKTEPTAWRLRLLGPAGTEVAREQSFLWSLPPAPAPTAPGEPASAAEPTPPAATSPAGV